MSSTCNFLCPFQEHSKSPQKCILVLWSSPGSLTLVVVLVASLSPENLFPSSKVLYWHFPLWVSSILWASTSHTPWASSGCPRCSMSSNGFVSSKVLLVRIAVCHQCPSPSSLVSQIGDNVLHPLDLDFPHHLVSEVSYFHREIQMCTSVLHGVPALWLHLPSLGPPPPTPQSLRVLLPRVGVSSFAPCPPIL